MNIVQDYYVGDKRICIVEYTEQEILDMNKITEDKRHQEEQLNDDNNSELK